MAETSFLSSVKQLCDLHLGPTERAYRVQPSIGQIEVKQCLKQKALDSFFLYLKDNSVEGNVQPHSSEAILLEAYKLRRQRKYEDADRLEHLLFNQVLCHENSDDLCQVLKFLLALKDCSNRSPSLDHLPQGTFHYPGPDRKQKLEIISEAPICYGDINLTKGFSNFYMHYPRTLFEKAFPDISDRNEENIHSAFALLPGEGLGLDCLFTKKFLLGDDHERNTHNSLFGALIQSSAHRLEVQLDLPDLAAEPQLRIPDFRCTKSISSTQLSEESGLGSAGGSMSSSVIMSVESSCPDDVIWDLALTETRSQHYTWEWIGFQPGPTERPYLTEAGAKVFDALIRHRQRVFAILQDSLELVTVETHILIKNILNMLIGVPSKLFPFNQETQSFHTLDGLHVSGISPESLVEFLTDFTECGSFFARLIHFSRPPIINSSYRGGLVFQAFVSVIRKILHQFHAAVLSIHVNIKLLQLKAHLHKAMMQIRYLSKLCQCSERPPSGVPGDFPTGMVLLSYLYNEASSAISSPHYPLLLSILQTSMSPFLLFIRDWVFHGVFTDSYQEFMILVDDKCLETRDEGYWEKAYTLLHGQHNRGDVPQVLADIVDDIVTCGKSINLLRMCNHQHFMCNVSDSEIPSISITFSRMDLNALERYCQTYTGRMREISRHITDDRQVVLQKIEAQKAELQQIAHKIADEEIARLQGIIDDRKRKSNAKKRIELKRLKEQMEEDLKRREEVIEEEKEADRQLVARINREEDALTEQEIEMEKKARDDLIAYYTELGEEAMHRERLALWKVRRAQLTTARTSLLEAQQEKWKQEMEQHQRAESVLDSVDSLHLPNWAERATRLDHPIEVKEQEENTMPSWAIDELPSPEIFDGKEFLIKEAPSDEENLLEEEGSLPRWVSVRSKKDDQKLPSPEIFDGKEFLSKEAPSDEENLLEEESSLPRWVTVRSKKDDQKIQEENNEQERNESGLSDDSGEGDENKDKGDANFDTSNDHFKAVCPDGPHPFKQVSDARHISEETQEVATRPHIQTVEGKCVTAQSEQTTELKPNISMVPGVSASTQSTELETVPQVRVSAQTFASKESDPEEGPQKTHLKFQDWIQVNEQTTEERQMIPRRARDMLHHASSESKSKDWTVKKPSLFGHVSHLSNSDAVLNVPRLRRHRAQQVSMESKDFGIKPCVRMNRAVFANKESDQSSNSDWRKPHIRVLAGRNASSQSEYVDENAAAIAKFKQRNVRGHASDSTVQTLLYGDQRQMAVEEDVPDGPPRIEIDPGVPPQLEPFQTEFPDLDKEPVMNLMSKIYVADLSWGLVDIVDTSKEDIEAYKYTPLSVLLTKSIVTPIRAQHSLVNTAVVNYFTSEVKIDYHFAAIRRYLLMADGDFAEILANILLEKLSTNPLPQEILNSVFLSGALNKAIRSSIHSNDEYTKNLSFATKYMPSILMPNEPNSLKCLELQYKVDWPLNIILTESSMEKYCQVFSFLLQIKRVVWVLKDVWHRLKRDALVNKVGHSAEFRHLQLHRQEMEHFVRTMQGYIANQVIQLSWQEFQSSLSQPIAGLDQLRHLHQQYVNKVIARCLLDKKAVKVMKIINDIFCLILKFRSQMISASWKKTGAKGEFTHANFASILKTYESFHVYSFFLFKVVNRLTQRGYQPHLQELLVQLNFNDYYTEAAN